MCSWMLLCEYSWFVECSRDKAEAILSLYRQNGSLLLRPVGSEPNNKYALSYRLETGGSVQLSLMPMTHLTEIGFWRVWHAMWYRIFMVPISITNRSMFYFRVGLWFIYGYMWFYIWFMYVICVCYIWFMVYIPVYILVWVLVAEFWCVCHWHNTSSSSSF